MVIHLGKTCHELLAGEPPHILRDEGLDCDVPCLCRITKLTGEDDCLPRYIHAGKIVARIGLGVAEASRLLHELGERNGTVIFREEPAERSGYHALDADDIAITGDGEIDGNCYAFVKRVSQYYVTGDFYPRPTMIYIEHCNHVTVRDITLRNAPFWTLHPAGCYDVLISNIRILNPLDVANSDGIDPDHSANVRIIGCHVEAADDCICLKSSAGNMEYGPTEDIVIADCTLKSTSAALKIGTEGTGDFKNIVVHGVTISGTNRGISIQIRDQGCVKNAIFSDITIETRRFAPCWWGTAEPIAITSINRVEGKESGTIENVVFENILASGENGVFIHGTHKVRNIRMRNVRIEMKTSSKWEKGLYDYRPGEGTEVVRKGASAYFIKGVDGLLMEDCSAVFRDDAAGAFVSDIDITDSTYAENRNFRTEGLD